jgi:K+-transporting ATPase A subunit
MVGRFGLAIPTLAFADLLGLSESTSSLSGPLPAPFFFGRVFLTTCLIMMVALRYLRALVLAPERER